MESVDRATQQMLLDIAYSMGDGSQLPFIEFARLVVDVLVDSEEPEPVPESVKANTVNNLWQHYSSGQRQVSVVR